MTMPQGPSGPPPGYQTPPNRPNQDHPTQHLPAPGFGPQGPPPGFQGPPNGPGGPGHPGPNQPGQNHPGQNHPGQNHPGQNHPGQPGATGPGAFGPPQRSGQGRPKVFTAIWTLGIISALATVAGLSISEDGANAWHTVHAWGGVAILGALLTLAPALSNSSLSPQRAWQISACGAGALVLFWVLFVLPSAGSNTSLATTIGVAAGVIATWIAPGREVVTGSDKPRDHSW